MINKNLFPYIAHAIHDIPIHACTVFWANKFASKLAIVFPNKMFGSMSFGREREKLHSKGWETIQVEAITLWLQGENIHIYDSYVAIFHTQ